MLLRGTAERRSGKTMNISLSRFRLDNTTVVKVDAAFGLVVSAECKNEVDGGKGTRESWNHAEASCKKSDDTAYNEASRKGAKRY